jgi:glycosyltransferase involved in cell wall biosynthesis
LQIAIGNRPPRTISLDHPEDAWLLVEAARQEQRIGIFGVSTVCNIFGVAARGILPVQTALLAALRDIGIPAWVDTDDDFSKVSVETMFRNVERETGHSRRDLSPEQFLRNFVSFNRGSQALAAAYLNLMAAASGVVVATEPLAETARHANPLVRVIPNAIDPDELAHTTARRGGSAVQLGMAGTYWKYVNDTAYALPGLLAAARRPGVALHFFGGYPDGVRGRGTRQAGRHFLDGVSYSYYPPMSVLSFQRALRILDVAAQPLDPSLPFNRTRSGQKWMEFALHCTAAVLQRLEPYELAIDGETCLKAASPEEWQEQLLRLVDDVVLRRRIGTAARAEVLSNHTLEARAPLWQTLVDEASRRPAGLS